MYCGDETGSFIGDIGSYTGRFGYGGSDAPSLVLSSRVVVADNTTSAADNNNNTNKSATTTTKYHIPTSCYNRRWTATNGDNSTNITRTWKNPIRSLQSPDPIVDPNQYLKQGDSIDDWDSYQHIWEYAIETMRVKDTLKHSKGGRQPSPPDSAAAAGGVASSTLRPTADGSAAASGANGAVTHPILAVIPGCTYSVGENSNGNSSSRIRRHRHRELCQLTEYMMETLQCGALFVAPTPMVSAFCHGRQTALIVDIGASGTRVTPVVDGICLYNSQRRNGRGGDWLDNILWQALLVEKKNFLRPRYQTTATATTTTSTIGGGGGGGGIFHRWAMQDLMYELRTSGQVALPPWRTEENSVPLFAKSNNNKDGSGEDDSDGDEDDDEAEEGSPMQVEAEETATKPPKHYELPDGTLIDLNTKIGTDICRVPELFFADTLPFQDHYDPSGSSIAQEHETLSNLPLHKLIHSSLSAVADVDVRKDLAANIVLTGGVSVTPNLEKRLSTERITSASYKAKVMASKHNVERQCAGWIGGSILTSLGSFQQLWLSKTEYEEYGTSLAIQRFP